MSNLDDFFTETNIVVSTDILEYIKTTVSNCSFIGNESYAINYSEPLQLNFTFNNLLDDFLKEFSAYMVLLKINAFTHVPWHYDESRKRRSVINLILDKYVDNSTYFTDAKSYEELNYKKYNTWVCPYRYQIPMIVNVSEKLHCVFNCDEKHRLVLSLCSDKISHNETIKWFNDKRLLA